MNAALPSETATAGWPRIAAILCLLLALPGCATSYVSEKYKHGPPDRATALRMDSVTQGSRYSKTLSICAIAIIPDAPGGTAERSLFVWTELDALSRSNRPPVVMAGNRAVPLYLLPPEDIGGGIYRRTRTCGPLNPTRPSRLPIVTIEPGASGVQPSEEQFLQHVAARIQESGHKTAVFTARGPNGQFRLFFLAEKPLVTGSRILEIEPVTRRHTGGIKWLAAMPVAIAVDIVTFPVQLAALIYIVATFKMS